MNRLKKTLVIPILLIILCGCTQLTDGKVTVVDKVYHESYTTTTYVMAGKVMVPITSYRPEEYVLVVRQFSNKENKYIEDDINVDKKQYSKISIGDKLVYQDGKLKKRK